MNPIRCVPSLIFHRLLKAGEPMSGNAGLDRSLHLQVQVQGGGEIGILSSSVAQQLILQSDGKNRGRHSYPTRTPI